MATTYDFPSDLLAGQEELHQVRADLSALLKRLPWSVEPVDGFSDDTGWRKVERPASPGWSQDEQAEVEKLRQRERELAVFVTTHRYWAQFTGADQVAARSTLKHTRENDERPPEDH
ncbi:hypothetical protein [Streptomyces sp. CRN 30]|uniref:hypothetical protein n=1 Tax=Streptomyces sp. CRN 30 TaxID=3075613 RepID=UPI002A832393|nr:hypothetical protein [Streptomyces sp. CRN 30]